MGSTPSDPRRLAELLAPMRSAPAETAILCDLDGTLAPIVERPDQVAVPEATAAALRALADRYALVAVISGRRAVEARRLVGIEGLAYSGNHGLEMILPGEPDPRPYPSLEGHEVDAAEFVAGIDPERLRRASIRTEDKGPIVALHWRGAENEGEAESVASEIASEAEWQDLVVHRGRKVLEIRPNVAINKGIAVAALIPARNVSRALYGGDDRTDVDAFLALRTLQGDGKLDVIACIGVGSDEAPAELVRAADAVVNGPEGFLRVLRDLGE